jgi:hypothetical protein
MNITVIRYRTFLLVVWTVMATLLPPGAICWFVSGCQAAEEPDSKGIQLLETDAASTTACCTLWEINTRCIPSGTCLATCNQELVTYRFHDQCWTATSEAALRQEIEEHPAWTILFVHGNRTDVDLARRFATDLFVQLKCRSTGPIRLVCLSWPSEKPRRVALPSALVQQKKELIRQTGFQLVHFMHRCPSNSIQSMVGFSFGCAIISCALHLHSGGEICGFSAGNHGCQPCCAADPALCASEQPCCAAEGSIPWLRLGFIAPAMDRCALQPSGEYCCALDSVQKLINLYNSRDPVLRRFRFFDRENPVAAGYVGLMDTQFQPLAENSLLLQYDCRSIGATHALRDYDGCCAYGLLLDNILGGENPNIAQIPRLASPQ